MSTLVGRDLGQECACREDANALKLTKGQQVFVTCHDNSRPHGNSCGKHMIVVWIAASRPDIGQVAGEDRADIPQLRAPGLNRLFLAAVR